MSIIKSTFLSVNSRTGEQINHNKMNIIIFIASFRSYYEKNGGFYAKKVHVVQMSRLLEIIHEQNP